MNVEALKGHLDLLLLAALAGRPAHGYAIAERLRQQSGGTFDLPEGTIYPALHRLERGGLLSSHWIDANGRKRRIYQLTARGDEALAQRRREWQAFSRAVEAVVEV